MTLKSAPHPFWVHQVPRRALAGKHMGLLGKTSGGLITPFPKGNPAPPMPLSLWLRQKLNIPMWINNPKRSLSDSSHTAGIPWVAEGWVLAPPVNSTLQERAAFGRVGGWEAGADD